MRPPPTYWERYIDTAGTTTGGATAWPQDGPDPAVLKGLRERGQLRLFGILFESAGNLVSTPSDGGVPGVVPTDVTQPVAAGTFLEQVPQSIDPSTTALPLILYWGPTGPGWR